MIALLALVAALLLPGPPAGQAASEWTPRLECSAPRTIRLQRFEDGSARVMCLGRLLVLISVPG